MNFRPKQLLKVTPEGLEVQDEAMRLLKSRQKHAIVVSIIGETRTGKSFLLNKLGGAEKGFDVKGGIDAVTDGVWIWILDHPVEEDQDLILVDTEGLGHIDQDIGNLPGIIFTLIYLISSAIVYNVRGDFNENSLTQLSCFTFLGKMQPGHMAPSLIVTMRDYSSLSPVDDEFLRRKLELSGHDQVSQNEAKKKQIRSFFHKLKCFTFSIPPTKPERLHESNMETEFKTKLEAFVDYVQRDITIKAYTNSIFLTGKEVASLVQTYVRTVEKKQPLDLESIAEKMKQERKDSVCRGAVEKYCQCMDRNPESESCLTFFKANTKAMAEALHYWGKNTSWIPSDEDKRKVEEELQKKKRIYRGKLGYHKFIISIMEEYRQYYMENPQEAINLIAKAFGISLITAAKICAIYYTGGVIAEFLPLPVYTAIITLLPRGF